MFPEGFQYFQNKGCRTNELYLTYSIVNELNIPNIKVVDIVVKSSNPLRTFILQWAEFFKYNPPCP